MKRQTQQPLALAVVLLSGLTHLFIVLASAAVTEPHTPFLHPSWCCKRRPAL
jgi:hypothetical protein